MNIKISLSIVSLLAFALFGAGCAGNTATDSTYPIVDDQNKAPAAVETTPEPQGRPESSEVSTATDSNTITDSTSTADVSMNKTYSFPGVLPAQEVEKKVRIKTNKGDILVQVDSKAGPNAASNFMYLVKEGFYNGTIFHRVIPGFMIQGGDPTGTGTGGPGYRFKNDPVAGLPEKTLTIQGTTMSAPVYEKGVLAMANAGPDTNGSQFFIMVADYPLSPDYSIFGKVIEGQDVADAISNLPRNSQDRPNEEVKMLSVSIEE